MGLLGPYRATSNLEPTSQFFVSLAIGCLIPSFVDLAVWPVSRARVTAKRLATMLRSAADLMADLDPRIVLSPKCQPRWSANASLRGVVNLRAESAPTSGTPAFARDEETLRIALDAQRMLLARVEMARAQLAGTPAEETRAMRRTWEAELRAEAARLDREGEVVSLSAPAPATTTGSGT